MGQRGGGHDRITEYAGHIIGYIKAHDTQCSEETLEIWQKWRYSSVLHAVQATVQLRATNAASMKPQWARATPALHTHRFCAVTPCLRMRCETGVRICSTALKSSREMDVFKISVPTWYRGRYFCLGLGIVWIWWIPIPIRFCLSIPILIDSQFRFQCNVKKETFRYQTYLFCVSFCKTFNCCWIPWNKISWLHNSITSC